MRPKNFYEIIAVGAQIAKLIARAQSVINRESQKQIAYGLTPNNCKE
jgi:hypothetical protein